MSKTSVPDLISEWHRACSARDRAAASFKEAQEQVGEIGGKIARGLAPADIRRGESIGVWARDSNNVEECFVVKRSSFSHNDRLTLELRSAQRFAEKDEDQP